MITNFTECLLRLKTKKPIVKILIPTSVAMTNIRSTFVQFRTKEAIFKNAGVLEYSHEISYSPTPSLIPAFVSYAIKDNALNDFL